MLSSRHQATDAEFKPHGGEARRRANNSESCKCDSSGRPSLSNGNEDAAELEYIKNCAKTSLLHSTTTASRPQHHSTEQHSVKKKKKRTLASWTRQWVPGNSTGHWCSTEDAVGGPSTRRISRLGHLQHDSGAHGFAIPTTTRLTRLARAPSLQVTSDDSHYSTRET